MLESRRTSGDAHTKSEPIDKVLSQVTGLLRNERVDKALVRGLVTKVIEHSEAYGLTSSQADKVIRIALRDNRSRVRRISEILLRSIRPAPNQLFGRTFVLTVLASLGGTVDAGTDVSGLDDDELDTDRSSADESDDGRQDSRPRNAKQLKRGHVDIKDQARALRLLIMLHSPPAISSWEDSLEGEPSGQSRRVNLPSSFLTVEARRTLDQGYGILFQFLDYATLKPILCHLLCLITQRKHVRQYRIAKVLSLRAQFPLEPTIPILLSTYASFYPDVLFYESPVDRQSYARTVINHVPGGLNYPNPQWLVYVHRIWQRGTSSSSDDVATSEAATSVVKAKRPGRPKFEQTTHTELLPLLVPVPVALDTKESSLLVSDVASMRELGYRFDKVRLPDQLASCLSHRMTMVALLCRQVGSNFASTFSRIHEWASSAISDQISLPLLVMQGSLPFERTDRAHEASAALMIGLRDVIDRVGCCDGRLQARLYRLLQRNVWDRLHRQERQALLLLLEQFVPVDLQAFRTNVLSVLQDIVQRASEVEAAQIIIALAKLLHNWSAQNWQSILRQLDEEHEREVSLGSLRLSQTRAKEYVDAIAATVECATRLANSALCERPASVLLLHASLSLHEVILTESFVGFHDLLLPPVFTLYLPTFSLHGGTMALSRQFGIVQRVRSLHQDYMSAQEEGAATASAISLDGQPTPKEIIDRHEAFFSEDNSDRINDCVILLLDLVWRNNGFVSVESGNAEVVKLPGQFFRALTKRCKGRGDELEQIGSASHSAMLAVLMEAYANDLARQRGAQQPVLHGPVTSSKLKQARQSNQFPVIGLRDFRDSFVTRLAQQGARGLSDLLNATITRFIRGQELDQSTVFS